MEQYILSIDHGTTSTRAILFDREGKLFCMVQKRTELFYPKPGWVEQDAVEIWLVIQQLLYELIRKAGIQPSQISALAICNQRETTLLWNRKTGLPVGNAIVWQSRQSDEICHKWKEEGLEPFVRKITGLRIDPYFSASKIVWLLDHHPQARELLETGDLLFGTMESWIVWRMTAGKVHITDLSNASRTMLVNIETGKWSKRLLDVFGIPESILPEIVSNSEVYAMTEPSLFFGSQIPIASMIGDQQAALFGQLCLKKGMAKNTYGTGGFLLMNTGNEIVRSRHGLISTVAWKLGDEITYALEGSIFVSGSVMKWFRDVLGLFGTNEAEELAFTSDADQSVVLVPGFVGLGAPWWDDKARGAIFNLNFSTTKNELARAALESMAFQVCDVLHLMEKDSGIRIDSLRVDGGAAVNNYLLQFQSDLLGIDVIRYSIRELTALGAAFLAGIAVGFYDLENLSLQEDRVFVPENTEKVKKLFKQWRRAVNATRSFTLTE